MVTIGVFFLSNIGRRRWQPGKSVRSIAVFGAVNMNFQQAELEEGETHVTCFNLFGITRLQVPEDVPVKLSGLSFIGVNLAAGRGAGENAQQGAKVLNIRRINIRCRATRASAEW